MFENPKAKVPRKIKDQMGALLIKAKYPKKKKKP